MKTTETSDLVGQRKNRLEKVNELKKLGINPYPSKANRDLQIKELTEKFEKLENSEVTIVGRLISFRDHGKLAFGNLADQSAQIQLYIKSNIISDTNTANQNLGFDDLKLIDIGDFLEVKGIVVKSDSGEKSVLVKELKILTKSIRPLPTSLEDKEERFRRRYLDMTLHPEVRERFKRRSIFWDSIRNFLNKNGFTEINIPVLEHTTGGADAKPFVTHYDALNEDFFLRISHELPLKRLIGAGFEKVYDIGPRFRNEGFSDEHLPEHVAMEWYWAYADYRDGMEFTKQMYREVMQNVYGTNKFKMKGFEVDLGKEWEIIDYGTIIKERFGVDVFKTPLDEIVKILKENGVEVGSDINKSRAVDSLWKLIRKTIAGPAFMTGVPKYLSPLAKSQPENPELTERFHPIIAGSELANAFTELNDPVDQLDRFLEQQSLRDSGDDEAQMLDIDFVEMLEYGMPPTVGFGLSERVFWFFENVSAKEGVPFPQLKAQIDDTTKKIYPNIEFEDIEEAELDANKNIIDNVKSKTKYTSKNQDFANRIVIVVNNDLESWKVLNTVSHISAYLGHKLEDRFDTGEYFESKDGVTYPRNSQYPIVVLTAKPGQMANFMQKVRESGLLHHGFIKEMIETTNDSEIEQILANKIETDIEYLGVGVFGDNETLKKLTNKFSLYK